MGRRLILILTCALIVGLAVPAFAEVQNIKVSGDITSRFVERAQMDFRTGDLVDLNDDYAEGTAGNRYEDVISAFLTTVRLRVDADLTENVSAVVRLINERVWSEKIESDTAGDASDTEIELDLAYLALKEFLYEPLTLIIGRQPLRYGTGFIVGDPDTNQFSEYNHYTGTQVDTIIPEDLSAMKAFDAIRAILNYDPMVIDLIFAKIDEATVIGSDAGTGAENDDVDLWGVNVAYDWGGDKNLATETYVFLKETSSDGSTGGVAPVAITGEDDNDRVVTLGTKASFEPIERLYLAGEIAGQLGSKVVAAGTVRERRALAYQIISQYALDMKYSPLLKVSFTHYSGDKDPGYATPSGDNSDYNAWDPMFEDQSGGKLYNALFPASNCNTLEIGAQITPLEDVTLALSYARLFLDRAFIDPLGTDGTTTTWVANDYATYTVNVGNRELGAEIDLDLVYDYTEDVQFGLSAGWFMPGPVFTNNAVSQNTENAYQVIGSVRVNF